MDEDPKTGTIVGQVFTGDTKTPARFAVVFTIPIPVFDKTGKPTLPEVHGRDVTKTNLDGEYTLPLVAPGDYLVVAEIEGYLSPLCDFAQKDLENLTPDRIKKLTGLVPMVHVENGKTSHSDITLERGASISGTVTFDDGSPGIGVYVAIAPAQDQPNDKRPLTLGMIDRGLKSADDHGQYRITGLPDGKYIVDVLLSGLLQRNPMARGYDPDPYRGYSSGQLTPIYAEKTLHLKDAKVYEIKGGEDLGGADITIPLRGLYTVDGTVAVQGNQPPVAFGSVALQDVNDKAFKRFSFIINRYFQFRYLPPGKYELRTEQLSDQPPHTMGGPEQGPDHTYAAGTVTFEVVDKDLSGVVLTIPEIAKPTDTGAAKSETTSEM